MCLPVGALLSREGFCRVLNRMACGSGSSDLALNLRLPFRLLFAQLQSFAHTQVNHDVFRAARDDEALDCTRECLDPSTLARLGETETTKDLDRLVGDILRHDARFDFEQRREASEGAGRYENTKRVSVVPT